MVTADFFDLQAELCGVIAAVTASSGEGEATVTLCVHQISFPAKAFKYKYLSASTLAHRLLF